MSKFRLAASIAAEENGMLANNVSESGAPFASEDEDGKEYEDEDEDEDEEMMLVNFCLVDIWGYYHLLLQLMTYCVLWLLGNRNKIITCLCGYGF